MRSHERTEAPFDPECPFTHDGARRDLTPWALALALCTGAVACDARGEDDTTLGDIKDEDIPLGGCDPTDGCPPRDTDEGTDGRDDDGSETDAETTAGSDG